MPAACLLHASQESDGISVLPCCRVTGRWDRGVRVLPFAWAAAGCPSLVRPRRHSWPCFCVFLRRVGGWVWACVSSSHPSKPAVSPGSGPATWDLVATHASLLPALPPPPFHIHPLGHQSHHKKKCRTKQTPYLHHHPPSLVFVLAVPTALPSPAAEKQSLFRLP